MPIKYFILAFVLAIPLAVFGQTQPIKVSLKFEKSSPTSVQRLVAELRFDEKETTDKMPNGLAVLVVRPPHNSNGLSIKIDSNNNQSLADETPFEMAFESSKIMMLSTKTKTGQIFTREFEISAERDSEKKTDYVWIRSNYSSKGIFEYQGCSIPVALIDMNADGIFTFEESGSSFAVDRNNDGKIQGKGEWAFATEIMELCGRNFLIANIAKDGSSLSFRRTNLQNAKILGQSPQFSLQSVSSKPFSSNNLKGKPYLLDFWATWCGKCIDKMPEIKQLEGTLPIIYFNTDTIRRKQQALALADKLKISENTILRTLPNADNFYKSYQRLEFGLPYYVLIDGEGIIRYGGNGGDNLKELKDKIAEIRK